MVLQLSLSILVLLQIIMIPEVTATPASSAMQQTVFGKYLKGISQSLMQHLNLIQNMQHLDLLDLGLLLLLVNISGSIQTSVQ